MANLETLFLAVTQDVDDVLAIRGESDAGGFAALGELGDFHVLQIEVGGRCGEFEVGDGRGSEQQRNYAETGKQTGFGFRCAWRCDATCGCDRKSMRATMRA